MNYEFQTLGSVELLNSMPENAKVIVEVDGATRRAPQVNEIAKIVNSEKLAETPEDAVMLAEVNGEIKRVPQVDEIALIVGSEALAEVPEDATVLAEVNGEIKRVPGEELGGKGMVVNFTTDTETQVITADKTYEEVKLVLQEGRNVIGSLSASDENFSVCYTLNAEHVEMSFPGGDREEITFYSIGANSSAILTLALASDNTVTQKNVLEMPSTTSSVSSGSSALVTSGGVYTYVEGKGYQTEAQVTTLINNALG